MVLIKFEFICLHEPSWSTGRSGIWLALLYGKKVVFVTPDNIVQACSKVHPYHLTLVPKVSELFYGIPYLQLIFHKVCWRI